MKIHVVKEGDTLYELSKKYNVPLDKIIDMNPQIADPNQIQIGMKVKIPSDPVVMPPPSNGTMQKHIVQQGDTLWNISKKWGVPFQQLIEANKQLKNPNALLTGEVVYIPTGVEKMTKEKLTQPKMENPKMEVPKMELPILEAEVETPKKEIMIVETPKVELEMEMELTKVQMPPMEMPIVEKKMELPIFEEKMELPKAEEPFEQFKVPAMEVDQTVFPQFPMQAPAQNMPIMPYAFSPQMTAPMPNAPIMASAEQPPIPPPCPPTVMPMYMMPMAHPCPPMGMDPMYMHHAYHMMTWQYPDMYSGDRGAAEEMPNLQPIVSPFSMNAPLGPAPTAVSPSYMGPTTMPNMPPSMPSYHSPAAMPNMPPFMTAPSVYTSMPPMTPTTCGTCGGHTGFPYPQELGAAGLAGVQSYPGMPMFEPMVAPYPAGVPMSPMPLHYGAGAGMGWPGPGHDCGCKGREETRQAEEEEDVNMIGFDDFSDQENTKKNRKRKTTVGQKAKVSVKTSGNKASRSKVKRNNPWIQS